jgi:hypothetical protein
MHGSALERYRLKPGSHVKRAFLLATLEAIDPGWATS